MKKLVIFISICFLSALLFVAGAQAATVRLETSMGNIVLKLDHQKAPGTVANFLAYVKSGLYEGTIFHRVIKGFMIQGGGVTEDMTRKATLPPVMNEASNGLKNRAGTVAMARTGDPHSATSQFFINTVDNSFLDHRSKTTQGWGYCVFAEVIEGMSVVRSIEGIRTTVRNGRQDVPRTPVVIKKVVVISE